MWKCVRSWWECVLAYFQWRSSSDSSCVLQCILRPVSISIWWVTDSDQQPYAARVWRISCWLINWSQCPHNVQQGATRQGGDHAACRHLKSPWVLNFLLFFLSLSHSCAACASWLNDSSLSDYQELNCLFTLGVFLPYVQYVLCVCAGNWMFLQYWFLQYSVSNFLFVFVYKMETLKLCFIIIIFYLSYPCPRPRISILKYERSL